jgi:choline dehydrogenase-like flavoprotein
MTVLDLRSLPADADLSAEVCVIGSGPAGLTLAAELAGSFDVLVLESAGRDPDPQTSSLNETESIGAARVADPELVRARALGGTSRIWSGRCGALDELDYQRREWVPHSGWPISAADVAPYLERARPYLGLGPNVYDEHLLDLLRRPQPRQALDSSIVPHFWQVSRSRTEPGLPTRFDRDVLALDDDAVRVLLHATVTHINTEADGSVVRSVEVSCAEGRRATVTAQVFVLCGGGIENARLLLASDRVVPGGVGNRHDVVGRYLMDHPGCVIATIPPPVAGPLRERLGNYWLDDADGRHVYIGGVALSPDTQREQGLLNCAAFIEPYAARDDPWHAAQRLASRLRRQPVPEDEIESTSFWRHENASRAAPPSVATDVVSILRHGPSIVAGTYRIVRRRRPPLFRARRVHLYCLTEQVPDPDSRVTLSDRRDHLGVRMSRIDWHIADAELRSVRRLEELLGAALTRLGESRPVAEPWLAEESWRAAMTDRAHPIGTTRMADDPHEGVVDRNGAVHGVDGLYVAGSSTFPTSGHVNPMLTIVALSIRLADHLKDHLRRSHAQA